jgi:hypothetical protein
LTNKPSFWITHAHIWRSSLDQVYMIWVLYILHIYRENQ